MAGEDVSLAQCIVSYNTTTPLAPGGTYAVIPQMTAVGAIGSTAEKKEKTHLSNTRKRYGVGLKDAEDKEFKGQIIPFNDVGEEHEINYGLQQAFITDCKAENAMYVKIEWPDGEFDEFEYQPLGYYVSEPDQAEWKMFTVPGSQNSDVLNTPAT
jgi:hypothetical protein